MQREEPTHWKRPWCWERLKAGEGDEMVGWHHRLNRHEFEQALGVGDGQGSLECCNPWGHKELDPTEWRNWTEKNFLTYLSKHVFGDLEFSSHSSVHGMDYVFFNMLHLINVNCTFGFPGGSVGKESACNARGLLYCKAI